MTTMHMRELEPLTTSALQLADPADDLRGRTLCDRTGEAVGTVEDVWFDGDRLQARMLEMGHGGMLGIGRRHHLVPTEALRGRDEENVYVERDKEQILGGPEFWPDEITEPELHYAAVYAWYGVQPYWEAEVSETVTAGATTPEG